MAKTKEPEFLSVRNFSKLQAYKQRNPPWIRLYTDLLENPEFEVLPDDQKWAAVGLYLLASRTGNKIVNDPGRLRGKLGMRKHPDIKMLTEAGVLVPYHPENNPLADCKQNAGADANKMLADCKQNAGADANKMLAECKQSVGTPRDRDRDRKKETDKNPPSTPLKKSRKSPAREAPPDFAITDGMREWAAVNAPGMDLERATGMFLDNHKSNGKKFVDWTAAWRTWMSRAVEYQNNGNGRSGNGARKPDTFAIYDTPAASPSTGSG